MLRNWALRSFGAATLSEFWQYWNPVYGYVLAYYVYRPLRRTLPRAWSVWLTFTRGRPRDTSCRQAIRRTRLRGVQSSAEQRQRREADQPREREWERREEPWRARRGQPRYQLRAGAAELAGLYERCGSKPGRLERR